MLLIWENKKKSKHTNKIQTKKQKDHPLKKIKPL